MDCEYILRSLIRYTARTLNFLISLDLTRKDLAQSDERIQYN